MEEGIEMDCLSFSRFCGCDRGCWRGGESRAGTRAGLYIMVVFAGVAFLHTACMMGPDYTRPDIPKADSWRLTAATAESMANLPWWELLKDQALQQLVRTALQENLDCKSPPRTSRSFKRSS